jgi:hypothetical protein
LNAAEGVSGSGTCFTQTTIFTDSSSRVRSRALARRAAPLLP